MLSFTYPVQKQYSSSIFEFLSKVQGTQPLQTKLLIWLFKGMYRSLFFPATHQIRLQSLPFHCLLPSTCSKHWSFLIYSVNCSSPTGYYILCSFLIHLSLSGSYSLLCPLGFILALLWHVIPSWASKLRHLHTPLSWKSPLVCMFSCFRVSSLG